MSAQAILQLLVRLGLLSQIACEYSNVELTLSTAQAENETTVSSSSDRDTVQRASSPVVAWSVAAVDEWLRTTLKLPAVAEAAAAAGVDGASVLEMDKSAWKELGASGLQSAKIFGASRRFEGR